MTDFKEVAQRMKVDELERKIWALEEFKRETERRLRSLENPPHLERGEV